MPSLWPLHRSQPKVNPAQSSDQDPAQPLSTAVNASAIPPLIICEGFLSAAQSVVWGNEFRTYLGVGHQQLVDEVAVIPSETRAHVPRKRRSGLGSARPVVFAPIGPVSSLHDRACELFFALRGGTVDYGEQHSKEHGHARYGRQYDQPLCPSWGPPKRGSVPSATAHDMKAENHTRTSLPGHFIGHSLGGPTILKMQQLLRQGFFDSALGYHRSAQQGHGIHQDWCPEDLILSITSVSSPFRGTPLVYSLGSEPLPYPRVRMFSFGDMLAKFVHIAAFLDLPFFDPHADQWHFSAKRRRLLKAAQLPGGSTAQERKKRIPSLEDGDLEDDDKAAVSSTQMSGEAQAGVKDLLKQLWRSDWAGGRDCAPWDCTFAERDKDSEQDGWGLEAPCSRKRKGKTWYRSYAGGMTIPEQRSPHPSVPSFHRPETYWSLSPLTFTSHLIGKFDYSRLDPLPSFMTNGNSEGGEDPMNVLASAWWENDGVVPLASQFHPLECDEERCIHFFGMPASLPFGERKKRPQSAHLIHPLSPLEATRDLPASQVKSPTSTHSPPEPRTPIDVTIDEVDEGRVSRSAAVTANPNHASPDLLPLPITTHSSSGSSKSIFGSAKSAARIAYFTSLRALNVHDPPLVTPSEEDLISFLPNFTPSSTVERQESLPLSNQVETPVLTASASSQVSSLSSSSSIASFHRDEHVHQSELPPSHSATIGSIQAKADLDDLANPSPNKWYTFQLKNLDHTSLCPFWTGSELQKQFWTGMGFFLASVDRKAGYRVVDDKEHNQKRSEEFAVPNSTR